MSGRELFLKSFVEAGNYASFVELAATVISASKFTALHIIINRQHCAQRKVPVI